MLRRAFDDAWCKMRGNHRAPLLMENSCKRLAAVILHFAEGDAGNPTQVMDIALRQLTARENIRKARY